MDAKACSGSLRPKIDIVGEKLIFEGCIISDFLILKSWPGRRYRLNSVDFQPNFGEKMLQNNAVILNDQRNGLFDFLTVRPCLLHLPGVCTLAGVQERGC